MADEVAPASERLVTFRCLAGVRLLVCCELAGRHHGDARVWGKTELLVPEQDPQRAIKLMMSAGDGRRHTQQ